MELRTEGTWLSLSVRDDGRGFEVEAARERSRGGASFGLVGMQERALLVGGLLEIESAPGRGSLLRAKLPLRAGRSGSAS